MRLSTVHTRSSTPAAPRPGFTLIELLVVIGIIAFLITIVGVVATRARGTANKFQLSAQLQTIALALDAYKTEFTSLPPTSASYPTGAAPVPPALPSPPNLLIDREGLRGARLLCKMLMGASGGQAGTIGAVDTDYAFGRGNQDGKVGLGFTVPGRSGVALIADSVGNMKGKTSGPFLAPDKFKIANTATDADAGNNIAIGDLLPGTAYDDSAVLLDANGSPILYFPSLNAQPPVTLPFAYLSKGRADGVRDTGTAEVKGSGVSEPDYGGTTTPTNFGSGTPAYNGVDNAAWLPTPVLRYLLGDVDLSGRFEKTATQNESPAVRNQYILWTAGPDGKFGPRNEGGAPAGVTGTATAGKVAELQAALTANRYDDVNNLPQ